MRRTMNYKGFAVIIGLILVAFFWLHTVLQNDLHRKEEMLEERQVLKSRLEEENLVLNEQLSYAGSDEYIVQVAKENYGFVSKNDIVFTFSNPEALDAYTVEELSIKAEETTD